MVVYMTTVEDVRALLKEECDLHIEEERPMEYGTQLRTSEGPIVNVYSSGRCHLQGTNRHLAQDVVERLNAGDRAAVPTSRTVFVVYGHDEDARTELENMLRRWKLDPVVLDQLTSEGDTLIEKLERYGQRQHIAFAIVLATPDDEGHPAGRPTERKYRARQNVVLELGMMLNQLGRKKVAVLLKQPDEGVMERPSDIDGVIYIPFSDSVKDARVQLAKEMNKQGLRIDLDKL